MDMLGPEQSRRLLAVHEPGQTDFQTSSKGILGRVSTVCRSRSRWSGHAFRDEPPQSSSMQTNLSAADLQSDCVRLHYSHPSLVAAIDVSMVELPELEQHRYLALAVVFPRAPVPEAALQNDLGH